MWPYEVHMRTTKTEGKIVAVFLSTLCTNQLPVKVPGTQMLAANPASHGRLKSKPLQISTLPSNLSIVYPRSVTCQEHPISLSLVTTNQSPYRLYKFSHGLFSYSLQVIQCCLLHMWVLCHRCALYNSALSLWTFSTKSSMSLYM